LGGLVLPGLEPADPVRDGTLGRHGDLPARVEVLSPPGVPDYRAGGGGVPNESRPSLGVSADPGGRASGGPTIGQGASAPPPAVRPRRGGRQGGAALPPPGAATGRRAGLRCRSRNARVAAPAFGCVLPSKLWPTFSRRSSRASTP